MNFLYDSTFPYITIKQNKKKEIIKNEMSFFPNLSKVIEEIGLIKIFNDKKIICDYSNFYHVTYLMERKKGITNIKDLSIKFDFTLDVVLKAIDYMDKFFLCEKTNNIIEISSICLLISLKFNDSFSKNLNNFISHLQKSILNIIEIEQEILFILDYDLNTFSLMDIIHLFFIKNISLFERIKDSPEFTRKIWFYAQAIIEDQRYLDFNIFDIAHCLILFCFNNHLNKINNEDKYCKSFYKKLNKINKMKLVQCKFMLSIIISSRFKKM